MHRWSLSRQACRGSSMSGGASARWRVAPLAPLSRSCAAAAASSSLARGQLRDARRSVPRPVFALVRHAAVRGGVAGAVQQVLRFRFRAAARRSPAART
jgi:hypothetical protein